jgi:hypothetical protein
MMVPHFRGGALNGRNGCGREEVVEPQRRGDDTETSLLLLCVSAVHLFWMIGCVDEIVVGFRFLRREFSAIAARSYGKQGVLSERIRGGFAAPFALI